MRKYVKVFLTDEDWHLTVAALSRYRFDMAKEGNPTEKIERIIVQMICSPVIHDKKLKMGTPTQRGEAHKDK